MTKSMTSGNPLKLMLQFAFPLLLGNLLQQTYNIIDAAIVGQCLGAKALASVGASSSVQFLVLGFCMGSCAGFGVPIAKYYGANDSDRMRNSIFNGAFLTIVIAVVLTTACSLLCPQILHILSVPEDIYQNAYAYLIIIFLGMPFTLLYNYLSSVLRSVGDSKTPFLFLAISVVLNIFLDAFCILVLKWGCAGAAIATITSQAVSGILCLLFMIVWIHIFMTSAAFHKKMEKMVEGQDYYIENIVITDKKTEDASANNSISQNYFFYYHNWKANEYNKRMQVPGNVYSQYNVGESIMAYTTDHTKYSYDKDGILPEQSYRKNELMKCVGILLGCAICFLILFGLLSRK